MNRDYPHIALHAAIYICFILLVVLHIDHKNRLNSIENRITANLTTSPVDLPIQGGELIAPEPNDGLNRTSGVFRVTAYCPCVICCFPYADGITASGCIIQPGDKIIAAPAKYPFGTMMNVPGYGWAKVEDRGSAIYENRLDILFGTHQEALEWGVQYLEVEIY